MSHHDYIYSRMLAENDPPFYALIMAAMRRADSDNQRKLMSLYPNVYAELQQRYNAPGGFLAGEEPPGPRSLDGQIPGQMTVDEVITDISKARARRQAQ